MDENFKSLIDKFKAINNKGYIKGISNNITNSCGLTFEKMLNKKADNLFFPDYNDIEIKCKQRFSRYPISLFSLSFDGPSLYESNYLLNKYGKKDKIFKDKKTLILNLKCNEKILYNNKYYFELKVNIQRKKILLKIYDINMNFLEERAYIDFDSLKSRIIVKIRKLALIMASKKVINNDLYFRYYAIKCLEFKNFNTFINLIIRNNIQITLMLRFAKSGMDIKQNKNKNFVFSIKKEDLTLLFNEIYYYEN